ncbi:hypothetical protein CsSME_00040549 [Camellia sinensis var. sinensis]
MADFSFLSDSSDKCAVEELLSQAMDHSVLEQVGGFCSISRAECGPSRWFSLIDLCCPSSPALDWFGLRQRCSSYPAAVGEDGV